MFPSLLLLMLGVPHAAPDPTSSYLARNIQDRMQLNESCQFVLSCGARTFREGKHFFNFTDAVWSNESCNPLSLPVSRNSSFYFERLPSKYARCPCRDDVQNVVVVRNVVKWNSADLNPEVTTAILFDKLLENQQINLRVEEGKSKDFNIIVFTNSTTESDCLEGHHGFVAVVAFGDSVDITVSGGIGKTTYEAVLPNVEYMKVRGFSRVFYSRRTTIPAVHADYGRLFGISRFNFTIGPIPACDYICRPGSRSTSIRSAEENEEALSYITQYRNNTDWKIDGGIAIGLLKAKELAGAFTWSDKSPLNYTNWAAKSPLAHHRFAMMNTTDGQWFSVPSTNVTSCLCRIFNDYV